MKNCTFCGKPLTEKGIKKGRTEHFGCRAVRLTMKKSKNVIQLDSSNFHDACEALDRNPELINNLFI